MKLNFEKWVEDSHLPSAAQNLLKTAVKCYKYDIPTATLLMAYLGFLTTLKDWGLRANIPNNFPPGE